MSVALKRIAFLALGFFPVVFLYAGNPFNRIYSYHGLCHGALAYQVANGFVPPTNPFFAEYPLRYSWGYHFLAGTLTRLFDITPAHAFAMVNMVAVIVSLMFLFLVARRLLAEDLAAVLGTFVAIYAVTGPNPGYVGLDGLFGFLDWRGVPVFEKLNNANGVPLGVAMFSLLLYALVRCCEERRLSLANAALVFVSIAGGGFLYPQMLIGFLAATAAAGSVMTWLDRRAPARESWLRLLSLAAAAGLGVLVNLGYLRSISGDYAQELSLFDGRQMFDNLRNAAVLFAPVGVLLVFFRRDLIRSCDRHVLTILASVTGATGLLYICISQPARNEYKYLVLSGIVAGLLGGVALYRMARRFGWFLVVSILVVLVTNPIHELSQKWKFRRDERMVYAEQGRNLLFRSPAEDELYAWIRGNTPRNAVFVDSRSLVPIFGQRSLYVRLDSEDLCGIDLYEMFRVDDDAQLTGREQISRSILTGPLAEMDETGLASLVGPVHVVARNVALAERLEARGWKRLFTSADRRRSVFSSPVSPR